MEKSAREMLDSAEFRGVVRRRWRVSLALTAALFVVYYGYILLIATDKTLVARRIGEVTTLGIPLGIGVIGLSWALTVQGEEALAALATGAPEPLAAALRAALERARRARGRGRRAVALLAFLVLLPLLALLLLWVFRDALADVVVRRLPHAVVFSIRRAS